MIKNNFLMLTALLTLSACSSNINKAAAPMPAQNSAEGQAVRNTVDPRPAINDHVDNVNRYIGTTTTILHDNKPTR